MKILSQLNRSLEESEEEWALVEMLGMEFVIRLERGYGPSAEYGDVECFTLDRMNHHPKTLSLLRKIPSILMEDMKSKRQ